MVVGVVRKRVVVARVVSVEVVMMRGMVVDVMRLMTVAMVVACRWASGLHVDIMLARRQHRRNACT